MAKMSDFAIKVCRILKSGNPNADSVTCSITGTKFPVQFLENSKPYIDAYGIRYAIGCLDEIVISDIDSMESIAVLKPNKIDEIKYLPSYSVLRFGVEPIIPRN
jgi:hypothetical protein